MKSIYKYKIDIDREQFTIRGPIVKLLTVQAQCSQICVWAEIDTDKPEREFNILPMGTGWELDKMKHFDKMTYLGTVQLYGGELVWHMYYVELEV